MKINFCPYCGKKLDVGARFCKMCGREIPNMSDKSKEIAFNKSSVENHKERTFFYDGYIYKCPNCGNIIDAYETVCSSCGYEIRGRQITSVVHELALKLEATDDLHKKEELIRTFYIPNTKEDILEFFILANSNMSVGSYDVEAWYAKLEQAYQKAKLCFGTTPEFQYLNQLYAKAKKQQKSQSFIRSLKKSKLLQCLLLCALGAVLIITGFFGGSLSGDSNSPFYIIAMIGFYIVLGAAIYAMIGVKS